MHQGWRRLSALTLTLILGGVARPAAANLDLDEMGAALALPIVTGNGTHTGILITNAGSEPVTLQIEVVNGDPGEAWESTSFECQATAHETTLFLFSPAGNGMSRVEFECSADGATAFSHPDDLNVPQAELLTAATGIMFVAVAQGGFAVSKNVLFGDAFILDAVQGVAYSAGAIPFQSVDPLAQDGDQQYRFDGMEYASFPSALATNFLAPGDDVLAELILFTLDGTVSAAPVPAKLGVEFFNDDERRRDTSFEFDCFTITSLEDIDLRFAAVPLGSPVGHLVLHPQNVAVGFSPHELTGSGVDFFRRTPVHGWLVQTLLEDGVLFDDQPGDIYASSDPLPEGPVPGVAGEPVAAFGRPLAQSVSAHLALAGDVVNFDAR